MKKYILLTLVLTVIVIGPFAYQKWSEAKRLQHIRETKQLASQIQATPLTDYLHQLKQISPDGTPLLLFTGNTQAQLEPCGCFIGQSGGLPRRAKAIARIRETRFSPLLVDLGGIQPSQHLSMKPSSPAPTNPPTDNEVHSRDQHRVQTTLTAMKMMGYDAFFPFAAETEIVQEREVELSFPFLDSGSYLIKAVAGKRIAVVGLSINDANEIGSVSDRLHSLLSEVQKQSDFIVGLSHSPIEVNRTLAQKYPIFSAILSPYEGETEKVGDVLLAYCNAKGKTLGALMLTDRNINLSSKVQQIALTEQVSDDLEVRKLLDDFYH